MATNRAVLDTINFHLDAIRQAIEHLVEADDVREVQPSQVVAADGAKGSIPKKRVMSEQGRRNIAEAMKRRHMGKKAAQKKTAVKGASAKKTAQV